jgi:hypothetical protein
MGSNRDVQILAALAFARAGDPTRAERMADEVQKQFPLDTVICTYWLPTVRAAIEIDRDNPSRAIEVLKAAPYELGDLTEIEFGVLLYPAYVRGQAYCFSIKAPKRQQNSRSFSTIQLWSRTTRSLFLPISDWPVHMHCKAYRVARFIRSSNMRFN